MSRRATLAYCVIGFGFGLAGLSTGAFHLGYISDYVAGFGGGFGSCLCLFAWTLIRAGAEVEPPTHAYPATFDERADVFIDEMARRVQAENERARAAR